MGETKSRERKLIMVGPFNLTHAIIEKKIDRNAPGTYILGRISRFGDAYLFVPKYVGRSVQNLKERLKDHGGFTHFKFRFAPSEQEAFIMECDAFHRHRSSIINRIHPRPPKGKAWTCPHCQEIE